MMTPNSEVSRTVTARANASSLSKALKRVVLDKPSSPVRMLLTDDGMSVWTHDISNTMNLLITNSKIDDLKVKEPCVLLLDPDGFSDLLNTKFGNEVVQISTKANEPIVVQNKAGAKTVFHPADEDDCAIVPDRWMMPKDKDGWVQIPQKNNETCTTKISITRDAISKGMIDMKVSKTPYITFHFEDKKSYSQAGHWGAKSNESSTPIEATVEGESVKIHLSEIVGHIVSVCNDDDFVIYKHKEVPFLVIENGDATVVVAETLRED